MLRFELRLALALVPGGACVIPPELSPDTGDAGPSAPPILVEASPAPDFAFPGPIQLERQDARVMTLSLEDNDLLDVLYVKLFVDYGHPGPTPAWADCQAAPNGAVARIAECRVNALCTSIAAGDLGDHVLEAMVADRPFISDADPAAAGQPTYRALADQPRAASSQRAWLMRCGPADDL